METTVSVENLTRKFGDFTAVDNISFEVNRGEIFGFLGPNGAGKSTTIKMLCGILSPTSGSGHVSGYDIVKEQTAIKSIIGYMSQKFALYDDLNVVDNLEFFGSIYGLEGNKLKERVNMVLDMAEISGQKNEMVQSLPIGIKQRLAIGAAILHDPPVLFLDEPTSGVDPIMRRNFWELIYRFSKEGKTIFVTTHYLDEAEHCNRIALLISGRIIALDSPDHLKKSIAYNVHSLRINKFVEVFDLLSGQEYIHEAAIFGSDIHILSDVEFPLEKTLGIFLGEKGFNDFSIEKILPSLEDVFVTYARKFNV
ncbi:MAG: multidrug ABC transporter ATP-binding protein [Chloroflexi bacterium HGW-Chloroflexi-5]|jgi:ABC-2 type transport system ATP-binding protein|nr:MAG: multidrug ABC transporter ATP-binding protein [Deltaproteobacteria bacterium HGW-Deltaproteobacteria-13]PKN95890.1 MAG: multidrug ABC transporter ATP-binding protein [Chloroflexi bacterium HGW-Chloroflexi-5]